MTNSNHHFIAELAPVAGPRRIRPLSQLGLALALFPFGHGLSYTSFRCAGLVARPDKASFTVTNSGGRAGVETAQVHVSLPANIRSAPRQLAGWTQVALAPGESRTVTVQLEPLAMSAFDASAHRWRQPRGRYEVSVGGSSRDTSLSGAFDIR